MSPLARPVAQSAPPQKPRKRPPFVQVAAAKDSSSSSLVSSLEVSPAQWSGSKRISRRQLDRVQEAMSDLDWEVLVFVQGLRLVTGAQLRRTFWPGTDEAEALARHVRRSLQRLARWRVLDRLSHRVAGGRRGGSESYTWHVGVVGLRLLDRVGFTGRRLDTPSERYVRHTLGLTELVVTLVEADRCGELELIEWQGEPACWRAFIGSGSARVVLKPDLFLRIGAGRVYEDRWLVEFDMATESPSTLAGKLRRHLAYRASGSALREHGVDPRVLWLVPDARRADVVWELLRKLESDERRLFGIAIHRDAASLLAAEARA